MREFASRAAFVLCAFATCASHAWRFDPVATATGDPTLEAPPVPLALDASDGFPYDDLDPGDLPTTSPLDRDEEDEEEVKDTTPALTLLNTRTRSTLRNPFHPPGPGAYGAYAVLCVSAVVFAVGVMANVAIMCIVCHNYYMRSISNSLLANMAMWDFVIVFFCLPLVVFHQLTGTWLLGEFSCRIVPYLEVVCLGVTTFTLCALCIDRFRAATNVQLYYEMMESCASTSAKLAVIWAGALLLATPELLIRQLETGQDEDGGEGPAPSPARQRCVVRISTSLPDAVYVLGLTYEGARLWWCFGCYFCLPTLFTIGCSLATARRIQQAERRIPGGSAGSAATGGSRKQLRQESQMNCAVVALAILYGICVVPENICNIVSAYMAAGVSRHLLDLLQLLSQMLLFCKSAAAPVLLLCLCRPFRHTFLQCCCCCCSACVPVKEANATGDQQEGTNELELSPFSTETRDLSPFTHIGTHC